MSKDLDHKFYVQSSINQQLFDAIEINDENSFKFIIKTLNSLKISQIQIRLKLRCKFTRFKVDPLNLIRNSQLIFINLIFYQFHIIMN